MREKGEVFVAVPVHQSTGKKRAGGAERMTVISVNRKLVKIKNLKIVPVVSESIVYPRVQRVVVFG